MFTDSHQERIEKVLESYHSGDPQGRERYWALTSEIIERVCRGRFRSGVEATTPTWTPSVVQQEVTLSVLRYPLPSSIRTESAWIAWLMRVLKHRLADHGRRAVARKGLAQTTVEEQSQDLVSSPGRNELDLAAIRAGLFGVLDALPKQHQRRAIELFHIHGLTDVEVARSLSMTVNQVRGLIRGGIASLRLRLERAENGGAV